MGWDESNDYAGPKPTRLGGFIATVVIAGVAAGMFFFGRWVEARDQAGGEPTPQTVFAPSDYTPVDGDTARLGREKFRFAGIDAPEPSKHRNADCPCEAAWGDAASAFTEQRIRAASQIIVERSGTDKYGRTLATLRLDGVSLQDELIAADFAERTDRAQYDWCADPRCDDWASKP